MRCFHDQPPDQNANAASHSQISNIVEVYNEIVEPTDFGDLVDVMINVALGAMVWAAGDFDFDLAPVASRMLGDAPVYARINDVRREGGELDGISCYSVVYVTLGDEDDLQNPNRPPCYTPPPSPPPTLWPSVVPGSGVSGMDVPELPLPVRPGPVELRVDAAREYQVRVDYGAWSGFRGAGDGLLTAVSPLLKLPGVHRIELRSREIGRYWTRDEVLFVLEVLIVD